MKYLKNHLIYNAAELDSADNDNSQMHPNYNMTHQRPFSLLKPILPSPVSDFNKKARWKQQHTSFVLLAEQKPSTVLVYTDGSLQFNKGIRNTGFGLVGYYQGSELFRSKGALGEFAEVMDVEMEALIHAAGAVLDWAHTLSPSEKLVIRTIYFFSDSVNALQQIYNSSSHLTVNYMTRFHTLARSILNCLPHANIIPAWVPSHQNIRGNEVADKLAKAGAKDQPLYPNFRSPNFLKNLKRRKPKEYATMDIDVDM